MRRVLNNLSIAAVIVGAMLLASLPIFTHVSPTATLHGQGFSFANPAAYWVAPGNCNTVVSGNSTGTQGLTTTGAQNLPVVQAQTSATGTNTHTYLCNISPPYIVVTSSAQQGLAITDAVFFYGPVNNLGVQASTLASGLFNAGTVFSKISYPVAGTGETASTVQPVRADTGTLVMTPNTVNFNTGTQTAGAFFSVKFTPSAPIAWSTDLQQLLLTVILQGPATQILTTNSPGVLIHFKSQ